METGETIFSMLFAMAIGLAVFFRNTNPGGAAVATALDYVCFVHLLIQF